ncbi:MULTISPECIES: FMN-dependent NADH-azoreductase [unclassified Hyphomicrobium]|uniref:FMN-dependent NADH-azoreductase n=1 Tax=unclassified Hyphomicrobium TaxID=2619925 RepID=UPI000213DFB1|nr:MULTISPECIES: FMN-dependent NADH-azoreductase [unclassified Hyphomicrobium]CCB66405.1 FMN-dependent NADH-azoreductase (FMN-dependent NADH-azo compound oxidoreductase) (Azo-dye reductase) [Hyphomicrobium sp. MC1]
MKLLHVDSSILGPGSVSRQLSAEIVAAEQRLHPGIEVVYRDLAVAPVGHLSGAHLAAAQGAAPETADVRQDVAAGQAALNEFLAADIVVVGAPMYNFAIPSQLKAWIDRLAVAGKTFRYTEKGPEGLAGGKKVIIASSRGGFYGPQTPIAFLDHQETYLRNIFGFFGITDVTFVRAEGLNLGPDQRAQSIAEAQSAIAGLAA